MGIKNQTLMADAPTIRAIGSQRLEFQAPTSIFAGNAKNATIAPMTAVVMEINWLVLKFCTVRIIVTHKVMTTGSTVTLGAENALIIAALARYSQVAYHHNSKNLQVRFSGYGQVTFHHNFKNLQVRARRYRLRLGLQ